MGHTLRRPWSSKSYGATFVVLAMGFLSACGPMREEAHQANQPSIMHFVRYRHPPIAPPMVFVANRDRHFVNGVLYASTWGTTDKTPRSPIIWPIVLRSEEIHRMVFTFDTPIEPGTALLQIFGSINRSGYPDPSTPLYFCNTTQGTPARRCQITRSTDGQAEIQWHPNRLNSNQRIWYLSLLAQWPKLTHQKLTFYRGEWLFAVKRGRP